MATVAATGCLLSEFESLLQVLRSEQQITCYGTTQKKKRCTRWLAKDTSSKLKILVSDLVDLLKDNGDGIESLLEKIASLVMCKRFHQDQAVTKREEWTKNLPSRDSELSQEEDEKTSGLPSSMKSPRDEAPLLVNSARHKLKQNGAANIPTLGHDASTEAAKPYPEPDFDDSGYFSGDEEDSTADTKTHVSMPGADEPSSLLFSNSDMGPKTPQRPPLPVSNDSGFSEPVANVTSKIEQCLESPLTSEVQRRRQLPANVQTPTAPLEPEDSLLEGTSDRGPKTPKPRNFVSFDDPLQKLKEYLKRPLGEEDKKDGYIYGFQIENCAYTKIGWAGPRKTKSSLEDSFDERMDEHHRRGWHNPKVVLKKLVPHAHRVEKLIHYHLEAGRLKEKCPCQGGKCAHATHNEWFNVSLDEIYTVVIAWKHWILQSPYTEISPFMLSSDWRDRVDSIVVEGSGDHWLKWLCSYVPDLPRLISDATLDKSDRIEIWTRVEKNESTETTTVISLEEGKEVDEGNTGAREIESPSARLAFRLLSSKTWPRKSIHDLGEKD